MQPSICSAAANKRVYSINFRQQLLAIRKSPTSYAVCSSGTPSRKALNDLTVFQRVPAPVPDVVVDIDPKSDESLYASLRLRMPYVLQGLRPAKH
jgi:hypothetical protein